MINQMEINANDRMNATITPQNFNRLSQRQIRFL